MDFVLSLLFKFYHSCTRKSITPAGGFVKNAQKTTGRRARGRAPSRACAGLSPERTAAPDKQTDRWDAFQKFPSVCFSFYESELYVLDKIVYTDQRNHNQQYKENPVNSLIVQPLADPSSKDSAQHAAEYHYAHDRPFKLRNAAAYHCIQEAGSLRKQDDIQRIQGLPSCCPWRKRTKESSD